MLCECSPQLDGSIYEQKHTSSCDRPVWDDEVARAIAQFRAGCDAGRQKWLEHPELDDESALLDVTLSGASSALHSSIEAVKLCALQH